VAARLRPGAFVRRSIGRGRTPLEPIGGISEPAARLEL
jgi:hypothetical protein